MLTSMQDMLVRFNPQLVVIGSGQNMTLNSVFQLTYSIFSGDALITDTPLGNVTIDEPTLNTLVHYVCMGMRLPFVYS